MSDQDCGLRVTTEIPDETLMEGFTHSIGFWEGIKEAQAEVERGETYTVDEVRAMLKEWTCQ